MMKSSNICANKMYTQVQTFFFLAWSIICILKLLLITHNVDKSHIIVIISLLEKLNMNHRK